MGKNCHVYLLHFSRPLSGRFRHYLGQTARASVMDRVAEHRAGGSRASRLCRQAVRAGIELQLVRVWYDVPPSEERRLKRGGGMGRLCPVCRAGGVQAEL